MNGAAWQVPVVWAQATAVYPSGAGTGTPGASSVLSSLPMLALRRWFASLTLCSPDAIPSWQGLWLWLASLGAFMLLAILFQGPRRFLGQLFDVPGNARLFYAALGRMKRSPRMISIVIGTTVLSWTCSQAFTYRSDQGRDDMVLLTRARGLGELAVEQGTLAALTPLRDLGGLGSNLPLLIVAIFVLFRASADVWGGVAPPPGKIRGEFSTGWATLGWCSGALFVLYRLIALGMSRPDIPIGGCLMVEALVVPAFMAVSDGVLLAWVLAELRDAGINDADRDPLDPSETIELMPGSIHACLLMLPARYLATGVTIALLYFLPAAVASTVIGEWLRWFLLGWGVADLQAIALPLSGLAGAVAWAPGFAVGPFRAYARMLKTQGGRVLFAFVLAGLAAGVFSGASYLLLLSLPTAPWVLNAADSYAHYLTIVSGLWLLSALVELGERSLPEAVLITTPVETVEFAQV
jgi:hypothetical protein